jgi:galactokinase
MNLFKQTSPFTVIAPGRVNLLGEHVDYNDGPVLPAAIDRAVRLDVAPVNHARIHLHARDLDDEVTFDLRSAANKEDVDGKPLPAWARYPAGIAWTLQEHGFEVSGMQAEYTSNIPIGSGLSSSAAVEVGFAVAWQALGGWTADRMTLARLCQWSENKYVGVNCGLMDQFACAHGVEGHALYFDTRSLDWQKIPMPEKTAIVIADSGVRRSLTSSAYNERRASCEEAVRRLEPYLPGIHALRDVSPEQLARYAKNLPETVHRRARHIVEECCRVDLAVEYLRKGDAPAFGRLMFAGHASLRDLYEVSCPELDILVSLAGKIDGCLGARLTGAGFGGCTVNLVLEDQVSDFIHQLKEGYQSAAGKTAQIYLCHASQGAHLTEPLPQDRG